MMENYPRFFIKAGLNYVLLGVGDFLLSSTGGED